MDIEFESLLRLEAGGCVAPGRWVCSSRQVGGGKKKGDLGEGTERSGYEEVNLGYVPFGSSRCTTKVVCGLSGYCGGCFAHPFS